MVKYNVEQNVVKLNGDNKPMFGHLVLQKHPTKDSEKVV